MKTLLLKSWPYLTCFAVGAILFFIAIRLDENLKSLLINIAATLLAIPILFLIYDLAKSFSNRKLNKELFEYAKMQIDRHVLSTVMQLERLLRPYSQLDISPHGHQEFITQSQQQIHAVLEKETYLGFQVFKSWTVIEDNIAMVLENSFILQRLTNDQAIAVVTLLKTLRDLQDLFRKAPDLYELKTNRFSDYHIESGTKLNQRNARFPDRHLLLKDIGKNKVQVVDFGDFLSSDLPRLLNQCKANPKYSDLLATAISNVLNAVYTWVSNTGYEFLVDTRMFRM